MNTIYKRCKILFLLVAFVVAGMSVLAGTFIVKGNEYVIKSANRHLYSGGVLISGGRVLDRNGVTLSRIYDGERIYSDYSSYRRSTLHLVGDQYGFIANGVQTTWASELIGYNLITGVFNAGENGGNDLRLTVDADVNAAALSALDGRKGCVGVYNYKTGALLCDVSAPTYDVYDKPSNSDIEDDTTGRYTGLYLNKLFAGQYVPGSVFKTVTAVCAIENIPDVFSRTFRCEGEWTAADGKAIICNDEHGYVTFEEAFNQSCNVAFAQLAIELGANRLQKTADKLGLNAGFRTDRIMTAKGSVDLSGASVSDLGWAGFGQYTDIVNPAAIMTMMGAIANGGVAVKPYFVDSVSSPSGANVYSASTSELGTYMTPQTASLMDGILRSTVTDYYGESKFEGLRVCAKSGTAEVGGGLEPHAWFAGYSQREDFPYAFVVVVENGGSGYNTAGSVASEVLDALYYALDR